MSDSLGGFSLKLKDSYPQSENTVEGYIGKLSYPKQQQQQPLPAGIFPEEKSLQTSANWVSSRQDEYCSTPQQPLLSAPQHPPNPNNNYSLPRSQCSDQEPDHLLAGVLSGNVIYEDFIAADEQQSSSSIDPKTGFPMSWPEVSAPSPVNVTSTPVEQPSPGKGFPPAAKKDSPSNVPRTFPPPSPPPPPRCSCCIIL